MSCRPRSVPPPPGGEKALWACITALGCGEPWYTTLNGEALRSGGGDGVLAVEDRAAAREVPTPAGLVGTVQTSLRVRGGHAGPLSEDRRLHGGLDGQP
eukprot:CAMPEP_0206252262 /NCGR_PEP_ID=MMETSP0047_2-20121206/22482_1 /ASSEMBLY_ACC=CAM_ASM_000192 /TAXON_ID=195065 /ORGANISM="Chroomonas mesostigmatica_cf, Strain CCMP1168" /LENGTH=98 /DNA_ID=CAMNT_0053678307 /DNA_START=342 /DNA_END=634 /DNA_ORIENTATION=-